MSPELEAALIRERLLVKAMQAAKKRFWTLEGRWAEAHALVIDLQRKEQNSK